MSCSLMGEMILAPDQTTLLVVDVLLGMVAASDAVRQQMSKPGSTSGGTQRPEGARPVPAIVVQLILGCCSLAIRAQRLLNQRLIGAEPRVGTPGDVVPQTPLCVMELLR